MNVSLTINPTTGRINALADDRAYADTLKRVATREFDPRSLTWRYDPTPWVARALVEWLAAVGPVSAADDVSALAARALPVPEVAGEVVRAIEAAEGLIPKHPRTRFRPWLHQYTGSRLIVDLYAVYLAWEMGTGKTKGVIDAILELTSYGRFVPVLIVCPASVVQVWEGEFEKHVTDMSGIEVVASRSKHSVAKRTEIAKGAYAAAKAEGRTVVIVTNYESFSLDGSPFLKFVSSVGWSLLVPDEAHRLANPTSKISRNFYLKIGPRAKRKAFLSGTPMRNSPLDLFSQCRILDAGVMGANKDQFLERYAVVDFWGSVVGTQNVEELSGKFGLLAHRVDKRKVLDLPPVTVSNRRFDLSADAMAIYTKFGKELAVEFPSGSKTVAPNQIVKLLRLQQMTGGFVPAEIEEDAGTGTKIEEIDDGKARLLAEIIYDLSESDPLVVFCRFRHDLDKVRGVAEASGRGYRELSGRRNELREWQGEATGSVLGIQVQAGSVGVDATRAAVGVFYSTGFSLSDYEQAKARLDRPGQTRPVSLLNLIATGTVDEAVFGSIEKKGNVVEAVIEHIRGLA